MQKIKQNWFQIIVIVLLLMCYSRLGEISKNTFYTADIVDASTERIIDSFADSFRGIENLLDDVNTNTKNVWYAVQAI